MVRSFQVYQNMDSLNGDTTKGKKSQQGPTRVYQKLAHTCRQEKFVRSLKTHVDMSKKILN